MKTRQTTILKPAYQRAVKKSVSMPRILLNQAEHRTAARGFTTLSDYIQDLIRRDNDATIQAAPAVALK